MGRKTKRADAPWSKQKTPCKKNSREKKIKIFVLGRCCCWTCSGRARTWGKLDFKKIRDKKTGKNWKSCFTPHKWLIGMVAAGSARPATAAATATFGGQVWLGHPYSKVILPPFPQHANRRAAIYGNMRFFCKIPVILCVCKRKQMKWKMKNPMTNVVKILLLYWFTFRWDVIYREHKQNMIDWHTFFCSHLNTFLGLASALRHYWYVQNICTITPF